MQQLIYAVITSFFICLISGPVIIPALKRLKFGQTVREEGPQTHLKKTGTPTMGGVMIILSILIATFLFSKRNYDFVLVASLVMLGYGVIGFLDDFIKVAMKRSLGLRAYQKIIGQVGIAVIFAFFAYNHPDIGSKVIVPFMNIEWDLGIWYIPFIVFVVVGTVNSVNLNDGLDGLCAGVTLIYSAAFSIIMLYASNLAFSSGANYHGINLQNMMVFAGAVTGACLGFLRFNSYPAQVFMGDTGALALGGAVAMMAIVYRLPLLLPIMGGVYMAESISVILQVASFKLTGKRIFRMAPLHHHFEMKGMPETKVVAIFMIAAVILCLIGLLALR
ncbi:MAG: phospho-N-acetylmuramoyl-pentapeptide-transferase [Clostridia bacterium]|jgi:phospho-N-acetylmuramoyl-pentapeptide-transferase